MLDERWIRSLHVEALRQEELHAEREPHVLFQASTIGALLDGAYDGDLSFAELAEHGDLGLGTLNGLDGEMIALDGGFYRADVEGRIHPVAPEERTPFAVVTRFEPTIEAEIAGPLSHEELLARLDELAPAGASSCAVRLDGRFELGPGPLGPAPAPALPAADRGRRRTARVRARRGRRDDARLPLPELRRGDRGRRLPPALHRRARASAAATSSTRDRPRSGPASIPPTTSTSSCRRGSSLGDPGLSAETHAALVRAEGG